MYSKYYLLRFFAKTILPYPFISLYALSQALCMEGDKTFIWR